MGSIPVNFENIPAIDPELNLSRCETTNTKSTADGTGVREGGRNNANVTEAVRIRKQGGDTKAVREGTRAFNQKHTPPQTEAEVEKIINWTMAEVEPDPNRMVITAPKSAGTESRTADLFVDDNRDDALYCREHERWYVYDGTRFAPDTKGGDAVRYLAEQTAHGIYAKAQDAATANDGDTAKAYGKWANRASSMRHIRGALSLAQARPEVRVWPSELDCDANLLNVENGTLDLRTGELRPHSRADRLTRMAPVRFDPSAQCPQFSEFLERVQPDQHMREYVRRQAGTMLIGQAPEDTIFLWHGFGANGKTVAAETFRSVLGSEYSVELAAKALTMQSSGGDMERTFVPIAGARFVTSAELSESQRLNEQAVKRLTSGEPIRVRLLFAESREITPICTVVIATNHVPSITGDDDGIWRRIQRIPWSVRIPKDEQDPHLREKLASERAGILNWMLEGCIAYQRHGLKPPPAVLAATAQYREDEDILGSFIQDCCEERDGSWIASKTLTKALHSWNERNNGGRPLTSRALTDRLKNRGFKPQKLRGSRGWDGIVLKDGAPPSLQRSDIPEIYE